jgi:hypothetical protein
MTIVTKDGCIESLVEWNGKEIQQQVRRDEYLIYYKIV